MTLKQRLLDALDASETEDTLAKSWTPYTGPYGGEGWLNPQTGEVRYQDGKPAPEEGMEDEEGEAAAAEGEAETLGLDPEEDAYETDLGDFFEVGEAVELTGELVGQEEPIAAEVSHIDSESGAVKVDDGTDDYQIVLDDLAGESLEQVVDGPPDGGWESGWMEAPETDALIEGQTVEVYDTKAGEYVAGQVEAVNEEGGTASVNVQPTDAWEPGEDANYEADDSLMVGEESPFTVTAAEELTTTGDARPIEIDEAFDLSEGDEVLYDSKGAGLSEATVTGTNIDEDNDFYVELETEEGHKVNTLVDDSWTSIYDEPVEWTEPEEVIGLDFENPDASEWALLDGEHVQVDHPVHGEETGEAEIYEDSDGHFWMSVGAPDQPETLEVGDFEVAEGDPIELVVESSMPGGSTSEYDGVFAGLNDGPATGEYLLEDPDDEDHVMGFDAESLAAVHADHSAEGPDVAVTTNPDHPYYVGETLTQTADPWDALEDADAAADLKPGDKVADAESGRVTEVDAIRNGQVKTQAGTWTDPEDLTTQVDAVAPQEDITPDEAGLDDYEEWLNPWEGDDDGKPNFHPGDHVYYHDEETGEMAVGEVEDVNDGSDGLDPTEDSVLVDDQDIGRTDIAGYADTGSMLAGMEQVDAAYIADGEMITYFEENPYGDEPTENRAYVLDASPSYHDNHMEVMDSEGRIHDIYPDDGDYAVTDREQYPNTADFFEGGGDGMEMETDELVGELYSDIDTYGHDNYLSKYATFGDLLREVLKSDMQTIKTQMMTYFDPNTVDEFYDAVSNWKHDSGSDHTNQKLEAAFKQALDLEGRVRYTRPDEDGPQPSAELVKIAEVATQMSQQYYEDTVRPNTDGQLTRDASSTAFRSFLHSWAENPEAEEFELDGRALNNFQLNPQKWNYWRVTPSDVPAENIGLMTDMMFNPMETNSGEDEIWVTADDLTVSPHEVGLGTNRSHGTMGGTDFGGDIEEWDESQVTGVGEELAQHYSKLTEDEHEKYRPEELTDQQVKTFQRYADHAESLGVTKSNKKISDFTKTIGKEAQSRNLLDEDQADLPTGIESVDDLREGMGVSFYDGGEQETGDIIDVQPSTGDVLIENEHTGKQGVFSVADIMDITGSDEAYGPFDHHDADQFEPADFEPGEEAFFYTYSGMVERAMVLDVDDTGTVELSRSEKGGMSDFINPNEDPRLIPTDAVESAEGSDEGEATVFDHNLDATDFEMYDNAYMMADDGDIYSMDVEQVYDDRLQVHYWDDEAEETVYTDVEYDELMDLGDSLQGEELEEGMEVWYPSWDRVGEVTNVEHGPDGPGGAKVDFGGDYDELLDAAQLHDPDKRPDGPPDGSGAVDDDWTPSGGEQVEIEVPDTVDYDAESITAEYQTNDDGMAGVHYSDIPWLDNDDYGEDSVVGDLVNVDDNVVGPADGSDEPDESEVDFEPVAAPDDIDVGDTVRYESQTMDESITTEVVDIKESGTVELESGHHVINQSVTDTIEVPSDGSDTISEEAEQDFLDSHDLVGGQTVEYGDEGMGEIVGATTMMQDGDPSHVEVEMDGTTVPLHPNSVDPVDDDWTDFEVGDTIEAEVPNAYTDEVDDDTVEVEVTDINESGSLDVDAADLPWDHEYDEASIPQSMVVGPAEGTDEGESEDILGQIEDEIDSIAPDGEEEGFDSEALTAGDTITVNNFGGEQAVRVTEPNLPGDAIEVEDEDGSTFTAYESEIVDVSADGSDEGPVPVSEWDALDPGTAVELYEPSIDDSQHAEVVETTETVGGDPAVVVEAESGKVKTVKYGDSTEIHR